MHHVPHELVDDAVVALPPILTSRHQLHSSQERELVADGGHGESEGVGEVTNAKLLVRKSVHQPEPQGIRERVKYLHRLRDHFLGRKTREDPLDLLRVHDLREPDLHS